ncbi:MAG: HD domain-containing protein [Dysgonamonadaceae bacterium]|jgi:putative nucleotidyltransferase with HDIG domain|nr:HD domain-containing protein [Dysgonamonadaceae bacterium]
MIPTDIIHKHYPENNDLRKILITHSMAVAEKAVSIADNHPEMNLNKNFIYEAAMLHDIGVFMTDAPDIYCFGKFPYICHGYLGADLLRQENLPFHALVCERHTGTGLSKQRIIANNLPLPHRDMLPVSLEEQIVCFADKFFSKTKPDREKPVEKVRKSLTKHGADAVGKFDEWLRMFASVIVLFLFFAPPKARAQDAATDSIPAKTDSVKPPAIEAPIRSHAKDSIVMTLDGKNMFYLFGQASVRQQARELDAEYIELDADSSVMYASFGMDSVGEEFGYPVFKEGEQQYEMKRLRFNFKTKKMFIYDVITQQGEGYVTAGITKRMPDENLNMQDGKYTTCDEHDHPHYYFQMTRAKVRPGKNVVTGPAYLVVEDVPLPIAIPFGFFPFSKEYSSGIIVPTFDDEMTRGFSLRNGGYYFALSDYADLKLTGEIYMKGSWGLDAASAYRKRYGFSGNFSAGYRETVTGDKETKGLPNSDYNKAYDFQVRWSHAQDPKSNPYSTLNANVNFSTSGSRLNNLDHYYSYEARTENTKSSSVAYTYRHPTRPFSVNAGFAVSQTSRDTTLSVSLPNLTFTLRQIYPFKRKEQVGEQKWYEKINMSYTGNLKNSSGNVKEREFLQKNVIRDWKNGMSHSIPLSASFNLMKYITVSPSVAYEGYWYTHKVKMGYDDHRLLPVDTTYGFYWIHSRLSGSVSANTKLYGMYRPWSLFGRWTKGVQIRHVVTPSVGFSGSPDMSRWGGVYDEFVGVDTVIPYSPFQNQIFGVPGRGQSATVNFSIANNLEVKIPVGVDSTRKISLIDNLSLGMSYNFLADSLKWSNMSASIRLKILGQTLSLSGQFDSYYYDENGRHINKLRWGKGFGRFMGTSTGYSYSLNNDVIKKWFAKNEKQTDNNANENGNALQDGETDASTDNRPQKSASLRKTKKTEGDYDENGYLATAIPWNLSFNYSLGYGYGDFNREKREYNYRVNQSLGISGHIAPTKGWDLSFSTSYDFDNKRFATLQCNITRRMHCWQMTASIIPLGLYQSYNFMISVSSSLLKDLKYSQSSNYRDRMNWGD